MLYMRWNGELGKPELLKRLDRFGQKSRDVAVMIEKIELPSRS
jgi:hypothetical protein